MFVFTTHHPASQKFIKAEIGRNHPEFKFAYSRPGLTTFKIPDSIDPRDFVLNSVFARRWGFSLGQAKSADEVLGLLDSDRHPIGQIHVFSRPLDEDSKAEVAFDCTEIKAKIHEVLGQEPRFSNPGDRILDVILPNSDAANDPWFVGHHYARANQSDLPGGPEQVSAPDGVPSRAYRKIEEAIRWQNIAIAPGQNVLELGSAPGGAVFALLSRGLNVIGVDPGEMDPRVFDLAEAKGLSFVHLQKQAGHLTRADISRPIDWLLCDMNIAPQVALSDIAHAIALCRQSLKGAVITLKMNDEKARIAIPKLVNQLAQFGIGEPMVIQLPSNRSEVCAVLVRKGE